MTAIDRAIESAGGKRRLAIELNNLGYNVTRVTVRAWSQRGYPQAERVLAIEQITGVHRSELRPDIYPPVEYK